MKQGEIRWGHFPPPIGRRPVLLLSRTPAYHYLNKVIVVEITGTMICWRTPGLRVHVAWPTLPFAAIRSPVQSFGQGSAPQAFF